MLGSIAVPRSRRFTPFVPVNESIFASCDLSLSITYEFSLLIVFWHQHADPLSSNLLFSLLWQLSPKEWRNCVPSVATSTQTQTLAAKVDFER
jgi:hypothetical protein